MTQFTIDTADNRDVRALKLALGASTWQPTASGAFRIPSTTTRAMHTASVQGCSCPDFRHRGLACKHVRAVRIFSALQEIAGAP